MAKSSTPRRRRFQVQVSIDGTNQKLYDDLAQYQGSARRKRLVQLAELYLEVRPLLGLKVPDMAEGAAQPVVAPGAKGPTQEKKSAGGGKGGVSKDVKDRLRTALSADSH